MKPTSRTVRLGLLLAIAILSMLAVAPTQAAPATYNSLPHTSNQCLDHKFIPFWGSRQFIEAQGFNFDIEGAQASAKFRANLSLDVTNNPAHPEFHHYIASRMTEIDTAKPIADRVKCWQATPTKNVVVEYRVRFDQSAPQDDLNENLMLWNAPLAPGEPARPITSIGVSRNVALGQPMYVAAVTQDLDLNTFAEPFIFNLTPMPPWLDAGKWHRIRITLSQTTGQVEVAQGLHPFTTVLKVALLHPAEPLGFEFSVDNELSPNFTVPIHTPDGLDVSYLDIHLERAH